MVVRLSGTQPQGPKHLETLENKTVDGTQNTVRVNRGTTANRPIGPVIGDLYYNTELKDLEQYTEDGWMLVAKQVPRVPAIGSATLDGSNNASVSFTPSAYGQPASSYTVQSNPGSYTATASSSPISISGTNLEIGTAYTFRVRSTGSYGQSAYSAYTSSVTPVSLSNYESIQTVTVGAGGASNVEFTSIPSTYKHLQVRVSVSDGGSLVQLNSDTGTNYKRHYLYADGTSGYSGSGGATNGLSFLSFGNSSSFAANIIDILDYTNTNKYKTLRNLSGVDYSGSGELFIVSGLWLSTSAVTSIKFSGNTIAQGSTFALYGIKE
jgi:hypothetical protein